MVNNHASVKAEIREKVLKAIEQLGFAPNAIAQSMRVGSTSTIGCILRDVTMPLLAAFVRAAHDTLDSAGFSLLISNTEGREDRERALLANMTRRRIDGVIIGPYTPIIGDFRDFLSALKVPLVLLDRDQASWLDAVMIDHRDGTYRAVRELLELGHRRIALITGDQRLYPAASRLRGFMEAHMDAGVSPQDDLVSTVGFLPDVGFELVTQMLERPDRPTAIIAGGMDMLSGVLRAVRAKDLSMPHDVSVIGAGNSELAELYAPPVAMIDWDYGYVGRIAANLLLDRIRGSGVTEARHIIVPTHYIDRPSVGAPPTLVPRRRKGKGE